MATKPKSQPSKGSTDTKGPNKKAPSAIGAPSQRTQSSRKGKKAWRKNVNLDDVEEALEEIRVEERIVGTSVHSKPNDQLFEIDVKGDEKVRRSLPKYSASSLTSLKILSQRSAVPAIFSRPTASSSSTLKRKKITHEEKDRLLRMGKRMRKGPFNAVIDPTEVGAGSALLEVSEAAKRSGGYDVWDEEGESEFIEPKQKVKVPTLPNPRTSILLSAVPSPHEGTSYNPPLAAHQSLLHSAHEKEEKRVKEAEELSKVKEKMEGARKVAGEGVVEDVAVGMVVQEAADEDDEGSGEEGEEEVLPAKKAPGRKTKKERLKAAKLRAEKRALAEKLAQKRLQAAIPLAKSLRKAARKEAALREAKKLEQHRKEEEERMKKGLAGERLGRHIVPEGEVDVQLSEDLSESLRALKPEGNLFRDRFLSMQHRALIEPRVPVLPTKRKTKVKEYEKHAYKRFDREY